MRAPDRPLTADGVLDWARSLDEDPRSVHRWPHPFEHDPDAGGFACVSPTSIYWAVRDGGFGVGMREGRDVDAHLDEAWAASRHVQRVIDPATLGPWQRAALRAVEVGTTVARLPPDQRAGVETDLDRDHADWLWLRLRRSPHPPLQALAGDDRLLRPPAPSSRGGRRTHPCPLCTQPAPHADRHPKAVCDDCHARTVDSGGRLVVGSNVSWSGGFEARHEDGSPCEEVTRTGAVTVDGHPCRMGEAHFGGIVVDSL